MLERIYKGNENRILLGENSLSSLSSKNYKNVLYCEGVSFYLAVSQ